MTDTDQLLSTFPMRPFRLAELESLEEHSRIDAVVHDEETIEIEGPTVRVTNCVLITTNGIHAAVYDDDDGWQRVFQGSRPDAELSAAYDAIREFHHESKHFDRAPHSVSEAVYTAQRDHDDDEYAEGDQFECPVCGGTHIVQREDEPAGVEDVDVAAEEYGLDYRYVNCPDARDEELLI